MPRKRAIFSEKHVSSSKKKKSRGLSSKRQFPQPTGMLDEFLVLSYGRGTPTEEERRKLRASQLQESKPRDHVPPLEDADLRLDDEVSEIPNDRYQTVLGPTSFPEVRGKQPDRKPRSLNDNDLMDQVRPEDKDIERVRSREGDSRVAAISVRDEVVQDVDVKLSDFLRVLKKLRASISNLKNYVDVQEDVTERARSRIERMTWVVDEAIEPWFQVLDNHFGEFIGETVEGEHVGEIEEIETPVEDPYEEE